jgi:hypothetical protein
MSNAKLNGFSLPSSHPPLLPLSTGPHPHTRVYPREDPEGRKSLKYTTILQPVAISGPGSGLNMGFPIMRKR